MLSIIIPTLNEEKYLPRLLESIFQQNFSDYEVIVSDANSEDKTRDLALSFGAKVVVDERRHPSFQRNTGAKAAQGDLLLFLDADTVLPRDFLVNNLKEFNKRNLSSACFFIRFNPGKPFYFVYSFFYNSFIFLRQYLSPASVGIILAKKKLHDKISGFDEKLFLAEDYDYCRRISKLGKFRVLNSRYVLYSARRIEKEGNLRIVWKWFKMGTRTLFGFRIKKKIIKYDFGEY